MIRSIVLVPIVCLGVLTQNACVSNAPQAQAHLAVKSDCKGAALCYPTIEAALIAAQDMAPGDWLQIDIGPGHYHEKLTVKRPRTHLHGAGVERSLLQFDAVAQTAGQYHQ